MNDPTGLERAALYSGHEVGQLMQTVPLLPPTMTCGAVADLFAQQANTPAFVVQLGEGRYGLVDRNGYLTRYLDRYNRDIFQRRPITTLLDRNPLVVDHEESIDKVGLLVTSERPDALKSAFVITLGGAYAGIGMGIDLMRALAKLAEEASIAKTSFLTNMSHEIRTPLNAVIGNLELLAGTALDGEQAELARTASVSAHALLDLIGDLLDLSKIEADRLDVEMVECDIRAMVDEVLAIATPRARQKGLRLVARVAASVPRLVRSDPLRLRQVLLNFVGNAVKFTATGGVFIAVRADPSVGATTVLSFEVVDTGPGFDPARAALLFEPFIQEDVSTTRRFGGTGLGLAIAKRIVERLGGEVGCGTEPGLGAAFWCRVPMPLVAAGPTTVASSPSAGLAGPVIVIGEGEDRSAVDLVLAAAGITVAPSAQIDGIARTAIVIDRGDLEQTLARIESLVRAGIATILASAAPSLVLRCRAHRAGADHVLGLPADLAELPTLLARMVSAAEAEPVAAPARLARAEVVGLKAGASTVLVIDDTDTNRELAARQLRQVGLGCDTAENGLIGLEKTEAKSYALILVDGSMPMMDGLEFAHRFRAREQERGDARTPIVAVTAHALAGDAQRFLDAGMDDYLAKPVTLDKLRGKLSRWLDGSGFSASTRGSETVSAQAKPEALDRAALAAMLGDDDPAAIAEMVAIFRADFPILLDAIRAALDGADLVALARAAHAAKSAAASAAAKTLAARLGQLEELAPSGGPEMLTALVKAVVLDFVEVEAEADAVASLVGSP